MTELEKLEHAIAALEAQRALLGDAVVDAALGPMRQQQAKLQAQAERPTTQQRKLATILFADVSSFTALSEKLDPEDVANTLNALWQRLDAIIVQYGGKIDKHLGDGIMALWGVGAAREDDPERATLAALAMQEDVKHFATTIDIPLGMRIAVNTGPVLLSPVGTIGESTALGDTVNVASRLEQAAPIGGLLISHDTYRHVRGLFEVQALEPVTVKGKTEPIRIYLVLRPLPRTFRPSTRGVEGSETRTIGRDIELQKLRAAWQMVVKQRTLQTILISAEAGVGKSRLLHEFHHRIEALQGVEAHTGEGGRSPRMFRGRASQEMSRLPYSLMRDLFSYSFQIHENDSLAAAREKMEDGMIRFAGSEVDPDEAMVRAHFIGHLLGFDFSASPHLRGILSDAPQIRERAFHYATQFFRAATSLSPAALYLEDIHWADDGSLDLLDHLLHTCHDLPMLILCLTRPLLFERRPLWSDSPLFQTRIPLRPLSWQDTHQLVREILRQVEEIPSVLSELIVSRAEGNPFYVEELIKMLIEDGVIVKGDGRWRVEAVRLTTVRVPATLTGILQARLDSLPQRERETLQKASVIGREFWEDAVCFLTSKSQPTDEEGGANRGWFETHAALKALRRRELVFRRDASAFARTDEYIFKHALLHEVTYETVLKRHRWAYHAQAAAWLIEQSGERVEEYAGLIAQHYEQAGLVGRVAEWYERAADQAHASYVPKAAIDYYQKALSFLASPGGAERTEAHRMKLYEGLGDVLLQQARYPEAIDAYAAMQEAAREAGDVLAQARSWNRISMVHEELGAMRAHLESAEQAERLLRSLDERPEGMGSNARVELAATLYRQGWALYRLGQAESALHLAEQAMALGEGLGMLAQRERAQSQRLLGVVRMMLGDYEQADAAMQQALASFQALGDRRWVGRMWNGLGENARLQGDYQTAVLRYQAALTIALEIGNRNWEVMYRSNLGGALVGLGNYQEAEQELQKAIDLTGPGGWGGLVETCRFLAEAYLGQGRLKEADEAAQQAMTLSRQTEQPEFIGGAWRVLGMVASQHGEDGEAVAAFEESLHIFREIGMDAEAARTLQAWARHERTHGNPARGAALSQEARDLFAKLGMATELRRMEGAGALNPK